MYNNDDEREISDFYKLGNGRNNLLTNIKNMTKHSWRTIVGLAIIAVIAVLQALHGNMGLAPYIDMVLPVLLFCEHILAGKTTE